MDDTRSLAPRAAAIVLVVLLSPILLCCAILIRLTSPGPSLYRSPRIGQNGSAFEMLKFRTMKANTPQLATHLLADPRSHLTPVGSFLRKFSVDEFPQLVNVVRGEMRFVGPRPALFNQTDLMALRDARGVSTQKPGITGWAQVNGRDLLSIEEKVELEAYYLQHESVALNTQILIRTIARLKPRDVAH